MTRDDAAKLWPIIKAWSEGKEVQMRSGAKDTWSDMELTYPDFDCPADCYRIKPEQVECWALVTRGGVVLNTYRSKEEAERDVDRDVYDICRVALIREVDQ